MLIVSQAITTNKFILINIYFHEIIANKLQTFKKNQSTHGTLNH